MFGGTTAILSLVVLGVMNTSHNKTIASEVQNKEIT